MNALLKTLARLALGAWACGWGTWGLAAEVSAPADLVLRGGAVYTVNPRQPWAQAVAVRDGKFVAVGANAEVARHIGPATRVVELNGAMAMPGINDVHAHPIDGAYEDLYACHLPPTGGLAQMLDGVAACVKRAEPGDWIVGAAWPSSLMAELGRLDTLRALDAVSQGHPVVLRDDSFHNRWVNSAVLKLAGIGAGAQPPAGGIYVTDQGQPTGLLKEFPAFDAVNQLIPPRPPQRLLTAAQAAVRTLQGFGITAVQDAWVDAHLLHTWHQADQQPGGLGVRVVASLAGSPAGGQGTASQSPTGLALYDASRALRSDRLRPDFVKFFLDGVPMAYTAAFLDPYRPSHEHGHDFRGVANYSLEQLVPLIAELDRRGVPVKLHSAGDGAVRLALDAIAAVRQRNGLPGARHQIAHASFVARSDVARFRALNVTADISPMLWFPTPYTPLLEQFLGHERTSRFFPVKSLVRAGALVAGGSDWPAGQPTANPWIGIEGLVTRRNPDRTVPGVLAPDQAVDLATALRIYTRNSAEAMGLGTVTGSIEVGKSADLIVLNQPLFRIPAHRLHQTRVTQVYLQGQVVLASQP